MTPASLVWATDIDVLPADKQVFRRGEYLVVRSPSNPGHHWGNLLIFDHPPRPGDRAGWMGAYRDAFPSADHCTLAWDLVDGELGAAAVEFPDFELERTVGLVAGPGDLHAHPRANREVQVRALASEDPGWEAVLALWVEQNAGRENPHPADAYFSFARSRLTDLREIFRTGRGAWFVAEDDDQVVGSLGVVVTDGRLRYQSVDTRASHRRRGIASRLVVEAAQLALAQWEVTSLVIAADPDYHALGVYRSLGFRPVERVAGVCRWKPDAG